MKPLHGQTVSLLQSFSMGDTLSHGSADQQIAKFAHDQQVIWCQKLLLKQPRQTFGLRWRLQRYENGAECRAQKHTEKLCQVGELIVIGSRLQETGASRTYLVLIVVVIVGQAGVSLQLCHLTWLLEIKCLHQQVLIRGKGL